MEFEYNFEDEYDRYKTVKPIVQKHKRSFFIQNLNKVADNLQVQPLYLVKYISLKTNCNYEQYSKQNYLIHSPLVQFQVEELIDEFINVYLKCFKCKLLEFKIKVNKDKKSVQSKCQSCGAIKIHNTEDQMSDFIFKNPPIEKKKHMIEQSRGFLNEFNDEYDYSEDENEDIQYSYEDDDEDDEEKNQDDEEIYQRNEILTNRNDDGVDKNEFDYQFDDKSTEINSRIDNYQTQSNQIDYIKQNQQKQSVSESEEDNQKTCGDNLTDSSESLNLNEMSSRSYQHSINQNVVKNMNISKQKLNDFKIVQCENIVQQ